MGALPGRTGWATACHSLPRAPQEGGAGPRHPQCPQVAGSPIPSQLARGPACTPARSRRLPALSWLAPSCLQTGSRAGGCLLSPRPLRALGGSLSEGGAASGGPLRTRVPDALSGRAQPERPLCPAHWQPHKRCSHGSALGEVQTSPPHRATPGRCPPSIQRLPSPNPSAVSTPWPSICSSAGWSAG